MLIFQGVSRWSTFLTPELLSYAHDWEQYESARRVWGRVVHVARNGYNGGHRSREFESRYRGYSQTGLGAE